MTDAPVATKSPNPRMEWSREWHLPALGWLCCCVMCLLCFRGHRITGLDPYYYLEYTKQFTKQLPDAFGTFWPFGYPLLGTSLMHLGLGAYHALLTVCIGLCLALFLLTYQALRETLSAKAAGIALGVLGLVPVMVIELGGLRSEIAFSALLMASLLSLAEWPKPQAVFLACCAALLSFCIRYAGLLAFGMLGVWFFHLLLQKPNAKAIVRMLVMLALTAVFACFLMWLNQKVRGTPSGGPRPPGPGLLGLPGTVADMGWGLVTAFSSVGVCVWAQQYKFLYHFVGIAVFLTALALPVLAWLRPASKYSRPLALGCVIYLTGMVALYSYQIFDTLSSARTAIPVLAPLMILVCELGMPKRLRTLQLAAAVSVILGVVVTVRGISRELYLNYDPVLPQLSLLMTDKDTLSVSDGALSLCAHTDRPILRYLCDGKADFVLLGARLHRKNQTVVVWSEQDKEILKDCLTTHRIVWKNDWLILLKRKP